MENLHRPMISKRVREINFMISSGNLFQLYSEKGEQMLNERAVVEVE